MRTRRASSRSGHYLPKRSKASLTPRISRNRSPCPLTPFWQVRRVPQAEAPKWQQSSTACRDTRSSKHRPGPRRRLRTPVSTRRDGRTPVAGTRSATPSRTNSNQWRRFDAGPEPHSRRRTPEYSAGRTLDARIVPGSSTSGSSTSGSSTSGRTPPREAAAWHSPIRGRSCVRGHTAESRRFANSISFVCNTTCRNPASSPKHPCYRRIGDILSPDLE